MSKWQTVLWSSARTQATGEKDLWRTPPEVFDPLHAEFGFGLDAAALANSALLPQWLGPDHPDPLRQDALNTDWSQWSEGRPVWDNPPYSIAALFLAMGLWHAEHRDLVSAHLVFARTGTKWWFESVLGRDHKTGERIPGKMCAAEIRWRPSRIRFHDAETGKPKLDKHGRPQSGPAPSVLIVYRPGYTEEWPANGVLKR